MPGVLPNRTARASGVAVPVFWKSQTPTANEDRLLPKEETDCPSKSQRNIRIWGS